MFPTICPLEFEKNREPRHNLPQGIRVYFCIKLQQEKMIIVGSQKILVSTTLYLYHTPRANCHLSFYIS